MLTALEERALHDRLGALAPISPKTWRAIVALGSRMSLAKGEYFSQPGEKATRFAVVISGLLRHYYLDTAGKESVKAFRGPMELSGPYAEIIQGRPSRTFIEALTAAELFVFEVAEVDTAAESSLELQRLFRRFVEVQFVAKEQREYEFLLLTAEERYRQFCASLPELLQHIPQHQIASYIGITPVALSRIRGRGRGRGKGQ
ncbi:MAG: Crp/Fnr family transcriptional regulator [Myxococcales bacterium]|nr:Crp/Fnr family transcriptional regulator [Myxococcales bacterium]